MLNVREKTLWLTVLCRNSAKDDVPLFVNLNILNAISLPVLEEDSNFSTGLSLWHGEAYESRRWFNVEEFCQPVALRCDLSNSAISDFPSSSKLMLVFSY